MIVSRQESNDAEPTGLKQKSQTVGLLAGTGNLPHLFVRTVRERGDRVVVIAVVEGAFDQGNADAVHRVFFGQWERLLATLKQSSIQHVYVTGKFDRQRLGDQAGFDARSRQVMAKIVKEIGGSPDDGALMLGYLHDLEQEGLTVRPVTDYLSCFVAKSGVLNRHVPDQAHRADLHRAYTIAKAIAAVEAGQTAVVKGGAVLALEASEGTDRTIIRAGEVGGPGAVVVKVARPNQDRRFDLPVVGIGTVKAAVGAGVAVLAFEADETLFVDREEAIALADDHGMSLIAYKPGMEKYWVD